MAHGNLNLYLYGVLYEIYTASDAGLPRYIVENATAWFGLIRATNTVTYLIYLEVHNELLVLAV